MRVIFRIGKNLYIIKDPEGNILFEVSKCIWHAISKKCCSKKVQKEHWLDHADDKYDKMLIEDINAAIQALKLFVFSPEFWALFDQQGSRRTFQPVTMNSELDSHTIKSDQMQKLKYPKAVFFIVTNEFCERFSYYGMRTILVLYLHNKLNYDDDTATVIYHIFTMLVYFFPLLGAMLADSLLGKFKTIFYVSMIYAVGQLLLSASAAPPLGLPTAEISFVGLLLIALGTGGIKPCVSAFGGDQFILPQQERYLSVFFSVFYFAINSGSLISTFVTPILRSDVSCFGEKTCYSLAFFVPAILMIFSIIIFRIGKNLYIIKDPEGNILFEVSKCIWHAISKKCCSKKVHREHWLDHADDKYDKKLIEDIKAVVQVLKLFLPLPVFWALFDQQGSRWTFQATRMNGELGSYTIKADQMQVVNPLLILAFIPLCESCIYPLLTKIKLINTPLKKMVTGGCLASLAFIVSALVELKLEPTYAVTPSAGFAQFRIFNTLNCTIPMTIGNETVALNGLSYWEDKYVEASGKASVSYTASFAACSLVGLSNEIGQSSGTLEGPEATATSWAVTRTGLSYQYEDKVDKTKTGKPAVRGLIFLDGYMSNTASLRFIKNSKTALNLKINSTFSESKLMELDDGTYDIYLDNDLVQSSVAMKLGGIYTVVGSLSNSTARANTITVTEPNSMHMLWLIPQYVILTLGEVMFSITGLEFAFTQAPVSMKSILTAGWLLTVAFGNLIVVIVAEVSYFNSQASEFFLFAGLMLVDMLIFSLMAKFYKYVEIPDDESQNGDIALENKTGTVNESFRGDDEK
ncbi:solute carrier family 15 member 1 isoform X3 [Cephus cinctus]|uniref:Oligopeptide transporter 1 n=1 Tax=Cephus cinctus TaxID=211228 RepID=A0AAJ7RNH2_CEPCN|nr:solute carrier family 15 member 1 isoform X3 [Cephus cinctus]